MPNLSRRLVAGVVGVGLVSALSGYALGAQSDRRPAIYGAGGSSCGTWIQKSDAGLRFGLISWVQGYVSGWQAAAFLLTNAGFPNAGFRETDAAGMETFLTTYCQAHPLDPMVTAADWLVAELLRKP